MNGFEVIIVINEVPNEMIKSLQGQIEEIRRMAKEFRADVSIHSKREGSPAISSDRIIKNLVKEFPGVLDDTEVNGADFVEAFCQQVCHLRDLENICHMKKN